MASDEIYVGEDGKHSGIVNSNLPGGRVMGKGKMTCYTQYYWNIFFHVVRSMKAGEQATNLRF